MRTASSIPRSTPPPGADVPVPLLLARREPGAARAVSALTRRLAATLGHEAEACLADRRDVAVDDAVGRLVTRGVSRIVVLPLGLGAAGDPPGPLADALGRATRRWPFLMLHRGAPPSVDDVARMLGDRAREGVRALGGRAAAGEALVVLVGAGGANPAANAELARIARLVYEAHRFGDVGYAFLDVTAPSVDDVLARSRRLGARRVVVVPHLLFAGPAWRRLAERARAVGTASRLGVAVARPLAGHPALVWALVRRHLEALRDGSPLPPGSGPSAPYLSPELQRVLESAHAHGGPGAFGLAAILPPRYRDPGVTVSSAPMGAGPLELDPDGRVAWDRTWQGFCELALAGGPPHRGTLLEAPSRQEVEADPSRHADVLEELARAIRLVTGLEAVVDGAPGWIGVVCESEAMAIWLIRTIVVENVMVRREGRVLYLPAGPRFTLAGEIRNVVTALAKTHHYWTQHVAALGRAALAGEPVS
jgi:sirohydrochlorin cobaltochelatase